MYVWIGANVHYPVVFATKASTWSFGCETIPKFDSQWRCISALILHPIMSEKNTELIPTSKGQKEKIHN